MFDNDLYSDLYKDVYGFRPYSAAYRAWVNMSDAEKQEHWDGLVAQLVTLEEEEAKKAQEAAIIRFEERITNTIAIGARDRKAALKWIYDAECGSCMGDTPDWDYLCYLMNLPYGYLDK